MGIRANARTALLTPNEIPIIYHQKRRPPPIATPLQHERRRQIRGLLLLAAIVLLFSILQAGSHTIFHPGWWRLW